MAITSEQSQSNIQQFLQGGGTQDYLSANVGKGLRFGPKLNPTELQTALIETKGQVGTPQRGLAAPTAPAPFEFKPFEFNQGQVLPQIQQQAQAIYGPQQAQLEAIRELQATQTGQVKEETREDFAKQLRGEIEAINRRGAFFSGGARERESEIATSQSRALSQISLQAQAAELQNLTQQGVLSAEQSEYIQQRLTGAQDSAWSRYMQTQELQFGMSQERQRAFESQRAFGLQEKQFGLQQQQFIRDIFESDRAFKQGKKEFKKTYGLSEKEAKLARKRFKEDIRQFNEDLALRKFNARNSGSGNKETKAAQKYLDDLSDLYYNKKIDREQAKQRYQARYPDYDENEVYLWIPDNAPRKRR